MTYDIDLIEKKNDSMTNNYNMMYMLCYVQNSKYTVWMFLGLFAIPLEVVLMWDFLNMSRDEFLQIIFVKYCEQKILTHQ